MAEDDSVLEDEDLLEEMVRAIVADPAEVIISSEIVEGVKKLVIRVSQDDRGRVIGRQGKMILAIRAFMSAVGTMSGSQMSVELAGDERKSGSRNGHGKRNGKHHGRAHVRVPSENHLGMVRGRGQLGHGGSEGPVRPPRQVQGRGDGRRPEGSSGALGSVHR